MKQVKVKWFDEVGGSGYFHGIINACGFRWKDFGHMDWIETVELFWNQVANREDGKVCVSVYESDCPTGVVEVGVRTAGILKVPSGWLIVCDPVRAEWPEDFPPVSRRFQIGEWPVEIYYAKHSLPGANGLHLAATVRVGNQPVAYWEPAAPMGSGLRLTGSSRTQPWCVGVECGIAAFVDKAGMEALGKVAQETNESERLHEAFRVSCLESTNLELATCEPAVNAIVFGAGYGDGGYPCFVGFSADDKPVVLLTLFSTFDAKRTADLCGER